MANKLENFPFSALPEECQLLILQHVCHLRMGVRPLNAVFAEGDATDRKHNRLHLQNTSVLSGTGIIFKEHTLILSYTLPSDIHSSFIMHTDQLDMRNSYAWHTAGLCYRDKSIQELTKISSFLDIQPPHNANQCAVWGTSLGRNTYRYALSKKLNVQNIFADVIKVPTTWILPNCYYGLCATMDQTRNLHTVMQALQLVYADESPYLQTISDVKVDDKLVIVGWKN